MKILSGKFLIREGKNYNDVTNAVSELAANILVAGVAFTSDKLDIEFLPGEFKIEEI